MTTSMRLSAVHTEWPPNVTWQEINQMPAVVALPGEEIRAQILGIADVSCLTRFGVKGAGAAAWLETQGIPASAVRPNTWQSLADGGIVARLGLTEFLIEDSLHSSIAPRLAAGCQQLPAQVYPVLRQDLAIALCGQSVNELLQQTCNVNFQALALAENPVVLTSMVGVAVTVIPSQRAGQPFDRIWCDRTYGVYLWRTLLAIAQELGGGAIGTGLVL